MKPQEEDLKLLRQAMVMEQLQSRDIKDKKVLEVFRRVPRHRFVEPALYKDAYGDFPLPIGNGQTISQPYMVALMVQLLDIGESDKVLEIGTGSGYETAVLAEMAMAVFSVERIEVLAQNADLILKELGYSNVQIKIGDGTLGWPEFGPYNKIVVTAGSESVPQPLIDQLMENGRLVIPVGSRSYQTLMVLEKGADGNISEKSITGCSFVPLIGKYSYEGAT